MRSRSMGLSSMTTPGLVEDLGERSLLSVNSSGILAGNAVCLVTFDTPRCGNPFSRTDFLRTGSATPGLEEMY